MNIFPYEPSLVWSVVASQFPGGVQVVSPLPPHFLESCCLLAPSVSFLRSIYLADRNSTKLCKKCQSPQRVQQLVLFSKQKTKAPGLPQMLWGCQLLTLREQGAQSTATREQQKAGCYSWAPGACFINCIFLLPWRRCGFSHSEETHTQELPKNFSCAMSNVLLNIM